MGISDKNLNWEKHRVNRKKWIFVVFVNLIFLSAIYYFFYGETDHSAGNKENRIKIGVSFMTMNSTYFDMLNNEISSVIEEHGDVLITRDPGMNQDKQNEQIKELIHEGVKALFITPVDSKGIEPSLRLAREKGIKIVVVDSQVYDDKLVDCTVTSDNFDAGTQIANYLMTQKDSARIVLLEQSNVKSSVDRITGFKHAIKRQGDYMVVATKEYKGEADSALSVIEELIRLGVEFDTVFATNDMGAFGACAAIDKTEYPWKVNILGVNGSPDGKNMIKKKQMMATAAQFPTDMGKKAAESMYKLLNNKECEKEIYIPVKLITKYTIDSYDTDKWQ